MAVSVNSKQIKKKNKKKTKTKTGGDTKFSNGAPPLQTILNRHNGVSGVENGQKAGATTSSSSSSSTPPPDDPLHRLCSPEELAAIRERIKAKQKEAQQTPKLFFQLDKLKAAASSSAANAAAKLLSDGVRGAAVAFEDVEHLKSVFVESAAVTSRSRSTVDGEPFLFPFDVQELLLRGLLGGHYVPRWCNLLRFKFVSKVALVVVDGVSEKEWDEHVDCLPHLQCMMPELPARLLPPEVQGTSFLEELFNIPFSLSEIKVLDHFDKLGGGDKASNNNNEPTLKQLQATNFLQNLDELKRQAAAEVRGRGGSAAEASSPVTAPPSADSLVRDSLTSDGVVTWVDVDLHVDVTPRKDLLLTEPEMARENLPLPYTLPTDYPEEFVPLFESYGG